MRFRAFESNRAATVIHIEHTFDRINHALLEFIQPGFSPAQPLIALAQSPPAQRRPSSPAQTPADSSAPAPADAGRQSHCLVSAIDDTQVSAKEAGVITAINVREGQLVSKGDLLAQIDDAQPQMEKRKAMAEKNAAEVKANSDVEKRYDTAAAEVAKYGYLKKKEANDQVPGSVIRTRIARVAARNGTGPS